MIVENPFDSHVHALMTGLKKTVYDLSSISSPRDIGKLKSNRSDWILGGGWDDSLWPKGSTPHKKYLSHLKEPAAFTRVDSHAIWVNEQAIKLAGGAASFSKFSSDMCPRDPNGSPTGLLIDTAMNPILKAMPQVTPSEIKNALLVSIKHFNSCGFTHIRDLSCTTEQWEVGTQIEDEGQFTLAVEQFFDCLPYRSFDLALREALYCREQKSRFRRVKGIKVFFDGALGSEGALISCCYHSGQKGLQLLKEEELVEVAQKTWAAGLRLAIHMIGDEAADRAIDTLLRLKQKGSFGPLDFEHCELMKARSIEKLKLLKPTIHMQPCHWLSDKRWLQQKLPDNQALLFPWNPLENSAEELFFGSDCPIEPASILLNEKAIEDAESAGIPKPSKPGRHYQSHPDRDWVKKCWANIDGENLSELFFAGEKLTE